MKSIRHLVLLVAVTICALAAGLAADAQAASYYVNGGGGSDSNAGTEAKPWNTIRKADQTVKAGDIVYIKGTFPSSYMASTSTGNGSSWNSGGYVTYKVWGDSWADFQGGFSAITFAAGKKYVLIDGFYNDERRIRVYNTEKGFLIQDGANNIKITGCIFNPSGVTSGSGHCVSIQANYVWVYDNEINNSMDGTYLECVYIGEQTTPNIADHVYVYDNTFNIRTPTNIGHDFQAIDLKCVPQATDIRIFRNTFISSSSSGVGLIQVVGSAYFYDNYIDMTNASSGGADLFYLWDDINPAAKFYCYRNKIVGVKGGIIYTIGGINWSNMKMYFYDNIFEKCSGVISRLTGGVGEVNFYHNTFYNCTMSGNSGDKIVNFKYKNNLFTNWGTYVLADTSSQTSTWDGNVYTKSGASASSSNFQWNGSSVSFNTLRSSYGQESHGQFGTSASVDTQGLLTATLPVGVSVSSEMSSWPEYNLDFNSKTRSGTWDVGASQSGSSTTSLLPPSGLRVVQ